jgi:hypothetical protein
MKWIKKFSQFKESIVVDLTFNTIDLMESLNIWGDVLLSSISAQNVDIFKTLNLSDEFREKMNLDELSNNIEFVNSLSSIGLKKSALQNTDDFQTFLNKPCRFMFLYDFNSNELENPEYIIFQTYNSTIQKWEDASLYKVNDDIKKFYDKLASKTIEIVEGDTNYIYTTSNGNDWILQNVESQSDIYKRDVTKEDLQKIIDERKVKVNII